eukprot:Polyplicarium_translucidae@DN3152_c0_g1_i1.p2
MLIAKSFSLSARRGAAAALARNAWRVWPAVRCAADARPRHFSAATWKRELSVGRTAVARRWSSSASERTVSVPSMGDSITEGTINTWKKNVGEAVAADEVIAVIDTDKVSVDINSPASGVLMSVMAKEGETVFVGAPLYVIDSAAAPSAVETPKASEAPKQKAGTAKAPDKPPTPPATPPGRAPVVAAAPAADAPSGERREKMSRMRMRIAERLKGAQNTMAMLTTFNEVDMGPLMALRAEVNDEFKETFGCKLGFMSAFMMASTRALQKVPSVNACIDGSDIVYHDNVDISVAVATPTGLMVPVIRDCHRKGAAALEQNLADLAARARSNQIALEEMAGGTFTISNGGVYGSLMGTPIINPPQSGILGMHSTKQRPVVDERTGEVVARPMMYLALTYDHRLVDGREAVTFLKMVKEYVESPMRLFLGL